MRFFLSGPRIMGLRPGVIFDPGDIVAKAPRGARGAQGQIEGSFAYVISDGHRVKVGVSTDPDQRIAALQTGNPRPLSFSFVGVTPGPGYDIEIAAKKALQSYRAPGGGEEWFDTSPELATAALLGCAAKIGQKLHPVAPHQVKEILALERRRIAGAEGGVIRNNPGLVLMEIIVMSAGGWAMVKYLNFPPMIMTFSVLAGLMIMYLIAAAVHRASRL